MPEDKFQTRSQTRSQIRSQVSGQIIGQARIVWTKLREGVSFYWRGLSGLGKIMALILVAFILIATFAPWLSPYSAKIPSGQALVAPSTKHWLGTDDLGIDLWAQIAMGARYSLAVGFLTALFAGLGGAIIGTWAGYRGGRLDAVIMRIVDVMIALPSLPLIILVSAFFGTSLINVIIVLILFSWAMPARLVRSRVIALKAEPFILASQSYGAKFRHLLGFHFLPILQPLIMVLLIRLFSKAIVMESSLSFLGLGDPSSKTWGMILHHAIAFPGIYMTDFWKWWLVAPIAAIMLIVISIAWVGRDLETVFNPKLKAGQR